MSQHRLIRAATVIAALTLALGARSRQQAKAPELQTTTGEQPWMQPMTVIGCLRSGAVAEGTFVLTASETAGAGPAATYQLTGPKAENLRDLVGQQVEVSGTIRSEQEVASSSGAVKEEPAKGTSGTPTVETRSDIDVKRLEVASIKSTGNRCEK